MLKGLLTEANIQPNSVTKLTILDKRFTKFLPNINNDQQFGAQYVLPAMHKF